MRYAIFTFDGYGLAIAKRLQDEGRQVVVGVVDDEALLRCEIEGDLPPEAPELRQRRLTLYDGLLDKRPWTNLVERVRRRPDQWFAFFDLNHLYRIAAELRDCGCAGNFPTEEDYLLEIDRERAKELVASHYPHVQVAPKRRFASAGAAKRFLKSSEEIWVLKGLAEDARTVVPDVEDVDLAHGQVLDALAQHSEEYESAGFLLEVRIANALELTPQRIYCDGQLVSSCLCIENKPLGAGNTGPMTDCAQDLVFPIDDSDKLAQIAFPPIVDEIASSRRGLFYWDASLLADPRTGKLYFGEFCSNRPGYNCLYTEICLTGSASRYFESLVHCKSPYPSGTVAASVRVFNLSRDAEGHPLRGMAIDYRARVEEGLWLRDVTKPAKRLVTAGFSDTVAVMTGCGHSIAEAARRAYRHVDEFSFEGNYYRPQFDFLSREYRSSIANRLNYGLQKGYYRLGFGLD